MTKKATSEYSFAAFRDGEDPLKKNGLFRSVDWLVEAREVGEGEHKKVERVVRCSISSEAPYPRYMADPESGEYVKCLEVLGHKDGEVDDSRMRDGLVIQDTHWGDQVGIMDKPEIKDGKICGTIRFGHSQKAKDIEADALDGIKKNMSVGYIVQEYKRDGVDEKTGLPIFRVTKWLPYEASFVNVPADTNVGVGRAADPAAVGTVAVRETSSHAKHERKAEMLTPEQKLKVRELAASAHVSGEEVVDILASERSFEEICEELLNKREKYLNELAKKPAKPVEEVKEVIDEETAKKVRKAYNFTNVLRYLAAKSTGEGNLPDIGFEREISQEIAQKTGRAAQGILLPDFIRSTAGQETLGTPAHGVVDGLGGNGAATIATNLLAGNFIEALVDALVLRGLGMETITGLVGNVAIPKGGSIEAGWISSEGGNAAKKNPTFGQLTATPHTCGAYTDITRKLLNQSSVDVQAKVTGWLLYACAACMEKACFQGSGENGEPTGLASLIAANHTKAFGNAPSYDKLVSLIAAVRKDNAFIPAMRFVGDNGVWEVLAKTLDYLEIKGAQDATVAAVGGVRRLLDADTNKCVGKDFVESHLVPAKTLFFGDFSQLSLCLWSGTDIIVDPYANSTAGGLRIVALQDADVIVKRPEAFAKATGVHA